MPRVPHGQPQGVPSGCGSFGAFAAATADQIGQAAERYEKLSADHAATQTAHNQLADDFAALKTQLASEPAAGQSRKPSTGGNANAAGLAEF